MKKLSSILESIAYFGKMAMPLLIIFSFTFTTFLPAPVFADKENGIVREETDADGKVTKGCVKTAILGNEGEFCNKKNGGAIIELIITILDIITVGVGIIGVIAISWAGIMYLTAGGSEEKVRTAKRRLLEIVIGLAAYALLFAFLKWLLPGFNGTNMSGNSASIPITRVIASVGCGEFS